MPTDMYAKYLKNVNCKCLIKLVIVVPFSRTNNVFTFQHLDHFFSCRSYTFFTPHNKKKKHTHTQIIPPHPPSTHTHPLKCNTYSRVVKVRLTGNILNIVHTILIFRVLQRNRWVYCAHCSCNCLQKTQT
jgi:hypothetical protein